MHKKIRYILLTCLLLLAFATQNAGAVITIEITKGVERAVPIAIVPFHIADPAAGAPPINIAEVVASDLEGSGRFLPMPVGDLPSRPYQFEDISFRDWRLLGMENLVIGNVAGTGSGSYNIEFRLVDVYKGSQLAGYKIPSTSDNLRFTAHQISDIIYEQLTGQRGAFATRVAYITVAHKADGSKNYSLQIADADGYNAHTLLNSAEPLLSPSWSPDGQYLAYVSFEGRNSAIYIQNVSTGNRELVASEVGINSAPSWSPDGNKLAMTLSKDGNPEIYVMHLKGRRLQRITDNPAIDTEASWAPDGATLVFTSDRGGGPQIYKTDLLGSEPKRLTFEGPYNARASFSPDGRLLTMVHRSDGGYRIGVLDLETGNLNIVTEGTLDESPGFAPNGVMIIYAKSEGGISELAVTSIDGSIQKRLAIETGEVREPAWGPFRR